MTLEEIINLKIESLDKEAEGIIAKVDEETKEKNELENSTLEALNFIEDMSNIGWESILDLDVLKVTDCLVKYGTALYDKDGIIESLRRIKLVYQARRAGLDVQLDPSQKEFMEGYIGNLMKFVEDADTKIALKEKNIAEGKKKIDEYYDIYIRLQMLCEKIEDPYNEEVLDSDDFQAFYSIVEDKTISNEIKKQSIVRFIKYNKDRMNKVSKVVVKVNIEDVKELFKRFGRDDKRNLAFIEKHKDEIETRGNLENMESILAFFKENNIFNRFETSTLLSICLAGTKDTVEFTYNKLNEEGHTEAFYYQVPGIWVSNSIKRKARIIRKRTIDPRNPSKDSPLIDEAHKTSWADIEANEKFLRENGYEELDLNGKKNITKLLSMPNYKLVHNHELCEKYGLYGDAGELKGKKAVSPLYGSMIEEKMDTLIELGLFKGRGTEGNYVSKYPSKVFAIDDKTTAFYSYLMSNSETMLKYYDQIFSKQFDGKLSSSVVPKFTYEQLEEFKRDNFVNIDFDRKEEFDRIVSENDLSFHNMSIMHNPVIFKLEGKFKRDPENEFLYTINGVRVSRPKVLRICQILSDANVPLDEETIFYAVTKGMYLTPSRCKLIETGVGYELEKNKEEGKGEGHGLR